MNLNPTESTIELTQLSPPQILFGTEADKKSSSEQFLLSMYDSLAASIFVVDVLEDGDFRYVALNPTHERLLGISSDDLRGKKPEDILSPIDAARVRQRYTDCVLFGKTISYEQCLQLQGVPTWWSTTLTPLRDDSSRIYRLIGTSINITHIKQAEQGIEAQREQLLEAIASRIHQSVELETILHQTTQELRQFLKSDRVLIYRFAGDNSGVVIAESTAANSDPLLGKNIGDLCFDSKYQEHYSQGYIQVIEDIHTAGLHPCYENFLASLQVRANLVVPIFFKQEVWGLLIAQHCHQPRQWQQTETDLLKQLATQIGIAIQQAELHQQLEEFKAKMVLHKQKHINQLQQVRNFQALVRQMTEQIRDSVDESQVLQTVTQELVQLLKLDRCQIELYSNCQTLVNITYESTTNLPKCLGLTKQVADRPEVYQPLLQKQPLQFLEIVPGWQPKLLVVAQMACPIFDTQGIVGNIWLTRPTQEAFDEFEVGLVQQIANECAIAIRQGQLYQKTQAQVKELEKLERLKNEFLRTLSQELRTPITSISLAAQTLESVLTPKEILDIEIVPQLLQILHNECARENKLINDLLTLTSLAAEPNPPTLITIDLQTWLCPIIETFRDVANCQRQQLNLIIDRTLPLLETDITDLERIVTELLNHACKYTPAGKSITVAAEQIADAIELKITNSGIELTDNEVSRIFEPFYHFAKHDPWKHSGTGLELALVQKMVKHLGGSISVESAAGQTTFIVKLPV
ncbi:MAG: GAF domain-containing protein [Nostoc sp. ChiSLP02]|nr:GAF domain-containing protein [Nostoc sp. DedSLP05]MDZ8100051.1 GAF domain-containing protein [Nostoc sp. DedSLP01]MDZ8186608.1 GAF domain-containing protein [Nostoc sp. ChiSLP02]